MSVLSNNNASFFNSNNESKQKDDKEPNNCRPLGLKVASIFPAGEASPEGHTHPKWKAGYNSPTPQGDSNWDAGGVDF